MDLADKPKHFTDMYKTIAVDPKARPTCAAAMAHPFFSGVEFREFEQGAVVPPYVPRLSGPP